MLEIRKVRKKDEPAPSFKEATKTDAEIAVEKAARKAEILKQARANLANFNAGNTEAVVKVDPAKIEIPASKTRRSLTTKPAAERPTELQLAKARLAAKVQSNVEIEIESKTEKPVKKEIIKADKPLKPTVKQWFQAIGVLYGVVTKTEDELEITLEQRYKFRLDVTHDQKYWFEKAEKLGKACYWQVYPQYVHYPNKPSLFYFKLVREATKIEENPFNYELQLFRISGILQELPLKTLSEKRMPVITINRNEKAVDPKKKFRPQHIIFARPYSFPVKSFRYNPQAEKGQQMPKYFVDIECKFDPRQEVFTFFEQRNLPTVWVPPYKKYTQPDRKKKDKKEEDIEKKKEVKKVVLKEKPTIKPKEPEVIVELETSDLCAGINALANLNLENKQESLIEQAKVD